MKRKAVDRWTYVRRCVFFMLWCTCLVGLPIGSYAAGLSTSAQPPLGDWTVMHPSTFDGSIDSAKEQCLRDANVSESDALTPNKCLEFKEKLAISKCPVVMVPDKIVLDYLNGRSHNESVTFIAKRKMTGRDDRAFLCDLGGGLYGYWFTGVKGQSCNNVAFVLPPLSVPVIPPVVIITPPTPTHFSNPLTSDTASAVSGGIVLNNCCCGNDGIVAGSSQIFIQRDTLQSHGSTETGGNQQ